MAAQAVATLEASLASPGAGGDLYMIAMPQVTYRMLSDEAMKRGLTFAQALEQALNRWIETQPITPKSSGERAQK